MTGCTPGQVPPSTVTPDELFAHSRGDTRYLANRVFVFSILGQSVQMLGVAMYVIFSVNAH